MSFAIDEDMNGVDASYDIDDYNGTNETITKTIDILKPNAPNGTDDNYNHMSHYVVSEADVVNVDGTTTDTRGQIGNNHARTVTDEPNGLITYQLLHLSDTTTMIVRSERTNNSTGIEFSKSTVRIVVRPSTDPTTYAQHDAAFVGGSALSTVSHINGTVGTVVATNTTKVKLVAMDSNGTTLGEKDIDFVIKRGRGASVTIATDGVLLSDGEFNENMIVSNGVVLNGGTTNATKVNISFVSSVPVDTSGSEVATYNLSSANPGGGNPGTIVTITDTASVLCADGITRTRFSFAVDVHAYPGNEINDKNTYTLTINTSAIKNVASYQNIAGDLVMSDPTTFIFSVINPAVYTGGDTGGDSLKTGAEYSSAVNHPRGTIYTESYNPEYINTTNAGTFATMKYSNNVDPTAADGSIGYFTWMTDTRLSFTRTITIVSAGGRSIPDATALFDSRSSDVVYAPSGSTKHHEISDMSVVLNNANLDAGAGAGTTITNGMGAPLRFTSPGLDNIQRHTLGTPMPIQYNVENEDVFNAKHGDTKGTIITSTTATDETTKRTAMSDALATHLYKRGLTVTANTNKGTADTALATATTVKNAADTALRNKLLLMRTENKDDSVTAANLADITTLKTAITTAETAVTIAQGDVDVKQGLVTDAITAQSTALTAHQDAVTVVSNMVSGTGRRTTAASVAAAAADATAAFPLSVMTVQFTAVEPVGALNVLFSSLNFNKMVDSSFNLRGKNINLTESVFEDYAVIKLSIPKEDFNEIFYYTPEDDNSVKDGAASTQGLAAFSTLPSMKVMRGETISVYHAVDDWTALVSTGLDVNTTEVIPSDSQYFQQDVLVAASLSTISNLVIENWSYDIFGAGGLKDSFSSLVAMENEINGYLTDTTSAGETVTTTTALGANLNTDIKIALANANIISDADYLRDTTINPESNADSTEDGLAGDISNVRSNIGLFLLYQLRNKIDGTDQAYRLTNQQGGLFNNKNKDITNGAGRYPFKFLAGDKISVGITFSHKDVVGSGHYFGLPTMLQVVKPLGDIPFQLEITMT
jgi:hypothetical protein